MLLCRLFSVFGIFNYILPSSSCADKLSRENFGNNEVIDEAVPDPIHFLLDGLQNENVAEVIDSFLGITEEFWSETMLNLAEYRKRNLHPGPWWLSDVRRDYLTIRDSYFQELPPETSHACLEILADYERRYSDIMFQELEAELRDLSSPDGEGGLEELEPELEDGLVELSEDQLYFGNVEETASDSPAPDVSPNEFTNYGVSNKPTFEGLFMLDDKNMSPIQHSELFYRKKNFESL